ncbi:MAG: outer membrane protein transport protein [Deltaproteobacteria bacterium]|nr:outer membrane protein transport protein [Deltaproteobacteria bacterium]
MIAVGAVHRALGGAGVARPLDSTAILLNPAGLCGMGDQFDLGLTVGFPNNVMDSSTAVLGNPQAVNAQSDDDGALLPNASMVMGLGTEDRWALGLGIVATSGFGVDYAVSRLGAAANGFDTADRYGLVKLIPAVAYRINDQWRVGASAHINYAFFQSNTWTGTAAFAQTAGRSRFDPAVGIGGEIGIRYLPPIKWLEAGITYTTRQYFEAFDRYADVLPDGFDMPQQVAAGLALTPVEGLLILTDFRWINWGGVGLLGTSPAAASPGLGWRDQYVAAIGAQYDFAARRKLPLTVRAGYNYGRSIISPGAVFTNLLVPGMIEHHITGGLSYDLSEKVGVDVAYAWLPAKTVTDDGSAVPAGAGARYSASAQVFTTQLHVKF